MLAAPGFRHGLCNHLMMHEKREHTETRGYKSVWGRPYSSARTSIFEV